MPRGRAANEDNPYSKYSISLLRREALTAAKQLGYDEKYFDRIKNAKSENELSQIMTTAREDYWNSDKGKAAMRYPDFKKSGKDQIHKPHKKKGDRP